MQANFRIRMVRKCCIKGCESVAGPNKNLHWFTPPFKNLPLLAKWEKKCGEFCPKIKVWHKICHRHFPERMILKGRDTLLSDGTNYRYEYAYWKLAEGAYPCIFNGQSAEEDNSNCEDEVADSPNDLNIMIQSVRSLKGTGAEKENGVMNPKTCVVIGCKSGGKNPQNAGGIWQWFELPYKNEDQLETWELTGCFKPESYLDDNLKPFLFICHQHFSDHMIDKGAKFMQRGGDVYVNTSTKWKLTDGAYPCLFSLETVKLMDRLKKLNIIHAANDPPQEKESLTTLQYKIKKTKEYTDHFKTQYRRLFTNRSKELQQIEDGEETACAESDAPSDDEELTEILTDLQKVLSLLKKLEKKGVVIPIGTAEQVPIEPPEALPLSTVMKKETKAETECAFLVDVTSNEALSYGGADLEHSYAAAGTSTSAGSGAVNAARLPLSAIVSCSGGKSSEGQSPIAVKTKGKGLIAVKNSAQVGTVGPADGSCKGNCMDCCKKVEKLQLRVRRLCQLNNNWKTRFYRLKKSVNKKKDKPPKKPGVMVPYKNEDEKKFLEALVQKKKQRYTADHLVDCVRLLSKGHRVYNFLRESSFGAMPAVETIIRMKRRLSSLNPTNNFGLNKYHLQLLKKRIDQLPENQRYVSIKFNEVFVKACSLDPEGPNEDSGTMIEKVSKRMQINAMVFTLESLSGEFNYVVSTYKTKGGLKGTEVKEKIDEVIRAIEETGAAVLTVSSNCSNPVKTAYKHYGVGVRNGYLYNSVPNFVNGDRKIFFFHDMTQVLKNIRKHIVKPKNTGLLFKGQAIDVKYIHRAFELDLENTAGRVCPELTKHHFNLQSVRDQKRDSSLALQMFSASIAFSIGHYRETGDPLMENSEATQQFVKWLGDLFDTLSTDDVLNAVVDNGPLLQNLENAYQNLNSDTQMNFASKVTMECLKLTVQSALELCQYLLRECNYQYVLTSKLMNQDKMETIVQM